ncbi:MAG: type II toxin-antitoxin system HicB family antitoxin [Ignavibacteriae bacterium]|jgi:predicted RNase H-like HicB family nuclease|nr:type II toxin-antitoxin system HicB family antitoxin [Ignavibacteriota bacterium]
MTAFTAIIEKCHDTNLFVGYIPGVPGVHTQAETIDELANNLKEVLELLSEEFLEN